MLERSSLISQGNLQNCRAAGDPRLEARPSADGTVMLSWTAFSDVGVFYYELYRDGNPEPWLTTTEPNFSFRGEPGKKYTFAVRAVDRLGQVSALSAPASVVVPVYCLPGGSGIVRRVEKEIRSDSPTVAELAGRVRVEIPAAAVKGEKARLVLEEVDVSRAAGAGMPLVGPVVDVRLLDGEVTGKLTITLFFDKSRLPEKYGPAIFYYAEKDGKWQKIGGAYDLDKGTVTAELDHLTLFAVFAVPKQPVKTFADVKGHWAEKVILELAGQGLLAGYPNGTFRPENRITRAEVVAALVRALKLAPATRQDLLALSQKMADAGEIPSWAQEAAAVAVRDGLVKGDLVQDHTVFAAGRPVTRLELALLLVRSLKQKGVEPKKAELAFADGEEVPRWAREDLALAAGAGLIKGYPDGTFRPTRPVTRAEAAALLSRFLKSL